MTTDGTITLSVQGDRRCGVMLQKERLNASSPGNDDRKEEVCWIYNRKVKPSSTVKDQFPK